MTDRRSTPDRSGRRWVAGAATLTFVMVAASCVPPATVPVPPVPIPVTEYLVADDVPGVSFAKVADVIGDSNEELVVSQFGSPLTAPGTVTLYARTGDLDEWSTTPVVTVEDGILFPNDTEIADLNGDGLADLIVSGGFFSCEFSGQGCGSLHWYEQGPPGEFTRHDIIEPDNDRFYHRAIVTDVDGDGITDLVTVGETISSARTEWYRGTAFDGADRFEPTPNSLAPGLLGTGDLDGDGRIDIVVSGDGDNRRFALLQNDDQTFTTYELASDMGQAGGAEVTDLDGDGNPEARFTSYEQGVVKLYEFDS